MVEEPFASGTSLLHRLDPRCKLPAALAAAMCIAPLSSPQAAFAALCGATCTILLAHLAPLALLRRVAAVNIFIALLWLVLPFSTPGMPLPGTAQFPLVPTREGLTLALLLTLKSNAIILYFLALAATSGITENGAALRSLGAPRKLTLLFLLTWRYLHVIGQEYSRLATAARIRGFVPASSRHTYRTSANLAAMVLVRSWDRAERVNNAMRLRGFHGVFHSLSPRPFARGDAAVALLLALPPVGCAVFDYLSRTTGGIFLP